MKANALCLSVLLAMAMQAQQPAVPRVVYFNGMVKDAAGKPQTGTVGIAFALYEEPEGGTALWSETQNVALDGRGRYTVLLGSTQPEGLPLAVFASGQARWLGVEPQVAGAPEQPRVLLVGVPYALKAADADMLGGLPASAFVQATAAVQPAGGPAARAEAVAAVSPNAACSVTSDGTATANEIAFFTTGCNVEGSSTIVESSGKVGIGTASPATTLEVKGATTLGGSLKVNAAGAATAKVGASSYPVGFGAASYNSSTSASLSQLFQWQAQAVGNNTASPSAAMNLLYASGTATPANTGFSIASSGLVSFAAGQTFGGTAGTFSGTVAAGTVNSTNPYQIGGANVLSVAGSNNLFVGQNVAGSNTGSGNTGVGYNALLSNTAGGSNTATGYLALGSNTTGSSNTAAGYYALVSNTMGSDNLAAGWGSLYHNTSGGGNTGLGVQALINLTTGSNNVAAGFDAGTNVTSGSGNIMIGYGSGDSLMTTDSNNIDIGNSGVAGDPAVVRIGTTGTHTATYIAGISGVTPSGTPLPVVINSNGQLGTGGITGVIAGTGLTGGGTSGNVGLAVNSGVVPFLSAANSFTNTQVIQGGSAYSYMLGVTNTCALLVCGQGFGTPVAVYGNGQIGVEGANTFENGGTGVYGTANGSSGIGVSGSGGSYGVYSDGNFAATGTKSALVPLPDDRVVSLYAVESPENWFEDFGSGQLENGVASVKFDSTFAQTVTSEAGYHVFLTPDGDCEGLYVAQKTSVGFEVRELRGGKSSVGFDYRIVARRKGLEKLRLEVVSDDYETAETIRRQIADRPSHTPRLVLPERPVPNGVTEAPMPGLP